jgi:hypothetical protein
MSTISALLYGDCSARRCGPAASSSRGFSGTRAANGRATARQPSAPISRARRRSGYWTHARIDLAVLAARGTRRFACDAVSPRSSAQTAGDVVAACDANAQELVPEIIAMAEAAEHIATIVRVATEPPLVTVPPGRWSRAKSIHVAAGAHAAPPTAWTLSRGPSTPPHGPFRRRALRAERGLAALARAHEIVVANYWSGQDLAIGCGSARLAESGEVTTELTRACGVEYGLLAAAPGLAVWCAFATGQDCKATLAEAAVLACRAAAARAAAPIVSAADARRALRNAGSTVPLPLADIGAGAREEALVPDTMQAVVGVAGLATGAAVRIGPELSIAVCLVNRERGIGNFNEHPGARIVAGGMAHRNSVGWGGDGGTIPRCDQGNTAANPEQTFHQGTPGRPAARKRVRSSKRSVSIANSFSG